MNFYDYKVRLSSNYDGDTVTLDIDLGFGIWKQKAKCRLYGINCPEIKTVEGKIARDFLFDTISRPNIELFIRSIRDASCKYGRHLVVLFAQDKDSPEKEPININRLMLKEHLASLYYVDSEEEIK
jgi:endonuclease YncB( thermonuclease family)